jgi:hypothetical protein
MKLLLTLLVTEMQLQLTFFGKPVVGPCLSTLPLRALKSMGPLSAAPPPECQLTECDLPVFQLQADITFYQAESVRRPTQLGGGAEGSPSTIWTLAHLIRQRGGNGAC